MLKHFTLAAILLAATAPLAHAQDASDDGGDRYENSDRAEPNDGPRPDMGDRHDDSRMRDMRHGDRWARNGDDDRMEPRMKDRGSRPWMRGPHGPDGRRGPPPPAPKAGFEIRMGAGQSIRVDCGEEMFAECVEAAQPILDAMSAMPAPKPGEAMGPAGDRVPPPPRGLVDTPTPGGDTPPPPPPGSDGPGSDAGDTPPPTTTN